MAKIIQLTPKNRKTYTMKVEIPNLGFYEFFHQGDHPLSFPYRIFEIDSQMGLKDFGIFILGLFNFDFDHMFGFYNHMKQFYKAKQSYVFPSFLKDIERFSVYGRESFDLTQYVIEDLFLKRRQKWMMLFDYGDEWIFHAQLLKIKETKSRIIKPKLIESKHEAPEQYPDWDEND